MPPVRVDASARRDEDDVRVGWIDGDAADHARVLEADVLPRLAAVGGAVDAVADVRDAAAGRVRLAGAGPQRSVRAARERADRLRVVVRPRRRVGRTGVGALPHAAAGRRDVDRVRLGRIDDDVGDTAADVVGAGVLPRPARGVDQFRLRGCLLQRLAAHRRRPAERLVVRGPFGRCSPPAASGSAGAAAPARSWLDDGSASAPVTTASATSAPTNTTRRPRTRAHRAAMRAFTFLSFRSIPLNGARLRRSPGARPAKGRILWPCGRRSSWRTGLNVASRRSVRRTACSPRTSYLHAGMLGVKPRKR